MLYIISGKYKNRKIQSPKNSETRPTTSKLRESLFNICQSYIEQALFLDVFCGSGAMGIEALSRGALQATFIDANRESIRCVRENLQLLEIENKAHLLLGDAVSCLKKLEKQERSFDIIYMDPPYAIEGLSLELVKIIDQSQLLKVDGMLFMEDSRGVLIDKEGWHTLQFMSARTMGRSQLVQFKKNGSI